VTLFPVIRDWIVEFLDDNKDMTASMVGRNMLVEQVRTHVSTHRDFSQDLGIFGRFEFGFSVK